MFARLSQIARLFEEYEFLGLIFEYKKTSATAVGTTSSAMGTVTMATDYDSYDNNFVSKKAMDAAEYSSDAAPYESFIHPVECDPRRNVMGKLYVVDGLTRSFQAPGDERLSVMGVFNYATEGQQLGGTKIGEIWVSYHVRLSRPILETTVLTGFTQHLRMTNHPAGPAILSNIAHGADLTVNPYGTATTSRLRFSPQGEIHVGPTFCITGSFYTAYGNAWSSPASPSDFTHCAILQNFTSNTGLFGARGLVDQSANPAGNGATWAQSNSMVFCYIIKFKTLTDYVDLCLPYSAAALVGGDIVVVPYNETVDATSATSPLAELQAKVAMLTAQVNGKDEAPFASNITSPTCDPDHEEAAQLQAATLASLDVSRSKPSTTLGSSCSSAAWVALPRAKR